MNTLWKFFQYGYLLVAIICLIEAFVIWSLNREKAYLFLGASIFITLVFFFKRYFRKKIEKRNNSNK
jgi:positive regulator of sigma E activity